MSWPGLVFVLVAVLPAAAGPLDLSDLDHATFGPGMELSIEFSVWNYAVHNPGAPSPTHLGLTVLGLPPDVMESALADSTLPYYPGHLFDGRLESLDGTASAPFDAAWLLEPGLLSLGGDPLEVAVLSGFLDLTPAESEAIFGEDLAARFVVRNLGGGFVLGVGNGYTIRQSIWEPDVRGASGWAVSGITGAVNSKAAPEPKVWMMGAVGIAVILLVRHAKWRCGRANRRSHSQL